MTKSDLLKPRFKLIADYPGNTQNIDNITTEEATASYFRKFTANFKELKWWEERDVKDMPKYVLNKSAIPNVAIKVDKWTWEKLAGTECVILTAHSGDKKHNFNYPYLMPLTEDEFNSFIGGEKKKEENNKENVV